MTLPRRFSDSAPSQQQLLIGRRILLDTQQQTLPRLHSAVPCVTRLAALLALLPLLVDGISDLLVTALLAFTCRDIICWYLCHAVAACFRTRLVQASACVSIRQHTPSCVSIRPHTSAYVGIRQHTSAYVGIRQHTSAYVSIRQQPQVYLCHAMIASAYVSIREHT